MCCNGGNCTTKTDVIASLVGPQEGSVCVWGSERDIAGRDMSVSVSASAYELHCVSPGCVHYGGTGRCESSVSVSLCVCKNWIPVCVQQKCLFMSSVGQDCVVPDLISTPYRCVTGNLYYHASPTNRTLYDAVL